jgi:carboxymethylenebutenolidase
MNTLSQNITQSGEHNVTFTVEGSEQGSGYLSPVNQTSQFGIVLLQEWWGMNKSITITADTFAAQGFRVICPDLYRGKVAIDHESAGHLMTGLQWQNGLKDVQGAMNYLKSIGCSHVGITGFCMGGALTIASVASLQGFSAAAPFYGIPDLKTYSPSSIQVPVLAHFGELDSLKGFSDKEAALNLEKEMKAAGVNFTLRIWPGANHAFMNQDSVNYLADTANQALEITCQFFKTNFIN